jgi:hypothetical protein
VDQAYFSLFTIWTDETNQFWLLAMGASNWFLKFFGNECSSAFALTAT